MANNRIDIQIRDLLTLCLTKAIHSAVSVQYGRNWFGDFAAKEAQYEPSKRIVQNGQTDISQCDLQACLKLLRYREEYCVTVLTAYGFFDPRDPQRNASRSKQFTALLDRLIRDYRNAMDAHARACDIQQDLEGRDRASLYTRQDAVEDMIKLAQILRAVRDGHGVSYYDRMCALRDAWLSEQKRKTYCVSAVIARERLETDKGTFLQCCGSLGMPIVTVDGEVCFTTTDYAADLARIRDRLALLAQVNARPQPKKRAVWPWILLSGLLLAALVAVLLLLLRPEAGEDREKTTETTTKPTGNVLYAPANYRNDRYDVAVNPRYVRWEGDELVAECYIINNLDVAITHIKVESLSIEGVEGPVCAGSFGELEELTVEGLSYVRWVFRFPANTVTDPDAPLGELTVRASLSYQ